MCFNFYMSVFRWYVLLYCDVRSGLRPTIFRTFLLDALTHRAEILHMTLFYCTTDQVQCRQFPSEEKLCPSWDFEYW